MSFILQLNIIASANQTQGITPCSIKRKSLTRNFPVRDSPPAQSYPIIARVIATKKIINTATTKCSFVIPPRRHSTAATPIKNRNITHNTPSEIFLYCLPHRLSIITMIPRAPITGISIHLTCICNTIITANFFYI